MRLAVGLLALLAARARARYSETTAGAVPQWQCGSNRKCTVNGFDKDKPEIVWVGPNDGGWIKVVADSRAPRPPPPVGDAHLRNDVRALRARASACARARASRDRSARAHSQRARAVSSRRRRPRDRFARAQTLIFTAIASFRDDLCPITLFGLFSRAAHPRRLRVGVVQQNAPDDVDCVDTCLRSRCLPEQFQQRKVPS